MLTAQFSTSSGSDHMRSTSRNSIIIEQQARRGIPQNAPSCGISCALETTRIWCNVVISGDRPLCTQSLTINDLEGIRVGDRQRRVMKGTYSCKVHIIEDVTTSFPNERRAVLLLTFLVEAVHLGDLTRLVVTTHEDDPLRVPTI